MGEYARTNATVINAYVGPKIRRVSGRNRSWAFDRGMDATLSILQCTGGAVSSTRLDARRFA